MSKWTDVNDKLPETKDLVLARTAYFGIALAKYLSAFGTWHIQPFKDDWRICGTAEMDSVTHWRELPE